MIKIAIDGHSGSGKSTLADGLAEKLGIKHLSTGAILRAMGLYFFENGIDNPSDSDVEMNLNKMQIKIDFDGSVQKTYLNGEDVTGKISAETIGQMASKVAAIKTAMLKVIDVSQDFAKNCSCVLDGRNVTTEILPDADVKIYLDADVKARAERRQKELKALSKTMDFDEVLKSLNERDYRDTHRDFSPLMVAKDAVVVDNTNMSLAETIDYCYDLICKKLKSLGKI